MLACGSAEEVILWGSDVFDASRIGPDLFTWEKFVETVGRARKYYAMHGIAMYNDPDCVVLRDEYSNENQARARLAFVSLLGMPLNFGDDLTALPKEKIDLLKRALPTLPIRSKSFSDTLSDNKLQFITLHISREFEKYAVAAVMNLTDETRSANISFGDTLRLHDAEYIAYDYFEDKLLGISDSGISTRLQPYETKVIILRPHLARPQLLSTSRHLSSGAAEISNITWSNEENMLVLQTKVIKNDNYCIKIFVPRGYEFKSANLGSAELCGNMLSLSYLPERSSEATFKISFSRR